jgi:periplasmic copper chaperone A
MTPRERSKAGIADQQSSTFWQILMFMLVATTVLALGAVSVAAQSPTVSASSVWIRHAPPGMTVHAGYLELSNAGPKEVALVGASSPGYERVELHLSKVVDGVATMEKLAQVSIAKGKSVSFKPGGLHLMLIKPKGKTGLGDMIPLELSFSDGTVLKLSAAVKEGTGAKKKHHDGGHHHMHHGAEG